MGAFQNYPYADVHQLNLDWIIKEVKEVKDRTDEIDQAVADSKGYAETAQESAENASQSASDAHDDLITVRGEISDWNDDVTNLKNQINTNTQNIAVDSARIDAIISGTTPDANAELIDIRVGANGYTYATAGDAVRDQIADLSSYIGSANYLNGWVQGGVNASTGAGNSYDTRSKISFPLDSNYVSVEAGSNYYVDACVWVNGSFVGVWNGTTCVTGTYYKFKSINMKKLITVMQPSAVTLVVQNLTNTPITQSDVPGNIAFIETYYEPLDDFIETKNEINSQLFETVSPSWEQGGINVTTGEFTSITYRIRAKIEKSTSKVVAPSTYKYGIFAFLGSTYVGVWNGSSFVKSNNWLSGETDLTALQSYNYVYWIVAGYSDDSAITVSQGSDFTLTSSKMAEYENRSISFSACPNIIFQCRGFSDTPAESKWYVRKAANNQYDRIRCSVRKTTDGYYFLCHDATINNEARNMDGTVISSPVSSSNRTLAELNQYDWGIKYGSEYAGASVPLLFDILKFASLFNMGVTWHSESVDVETDSAIQEQFDMIDKYGLTDNLIVITSDGHSFGTMRKIHARNPRISFYIGGTDTFFADPDNIEYIKELQSEYNKIYVQLYPWGTAPTDSFIAMAKANNFMLYDSITMSESDLLNENSFNKGYTLREVNDVPMVKSTIRNWADELVNQ